MPTCPSCKGEFRTRKNETCPGCGVPVKLRDGKWFLIGEDAPNIALLKYWEYLLGYRIGETFRLPRKSNRFIREAKFAQDRLDEAEGDLDIAKKALWILFNDKAFSWKLPTSMLSFEREWIVLLLIARKLMTKEQREEQAARDRYRDLMSQEMIWN